MKHRLIAADSRKLKTIEDESVQLVVTSPPYPMIEMWDQSFGEMDPSIRADLEDGSGMSAFEKMHAILVDVWRECDRVLEKNGFVCINIGDATRTLNGQFQLYSNHTAVVNCFLSMGYSVLPDILWRKPSNAPNKFMGSAVLFFKQLWFRQTKFIYALFNVSDHEEIVFLPDSGYDLFLQYIGILILVDKDIRKLFPIVRSGILVFQYVKTEVLDVVEVNQFFLRFSFPRPLPSQ